MSFRNRDKSNAEHSELGLPRCARVARLRSRRARRASRRGVLLLVVLSLLVLFMLIGTAFLMSSNQYRNSAAASAKHDRVGKHATRQLDGALKQLLRDTAQTASAIRSHSLLRDMYGSEGFEAEVYTPAQNATVSRNFPATVPAGVIGQVTRYATATTGAPVNPPIGPTNGQLIDIYVRQLAFYPAGSTASAPYFTPDDAATTNIAENSILIAPDTRHVLKLERGVNGAPQAFPLTTTKGYYNGALLTITSGPAAGQSTRIVEYEHIGDVPAWTVTLPSGQPPITGRLFRFRVLAFPRSDGSPLLAREQYATTDSKYIANSSGRGLELADLVTEERNAAGTVISRRGVTFVVNGRPFNGTGAGYNELARAGEPRLDALDTIGIVSDATKWLYPPIALLPNGQTFFTFDPLNSSNANLDLWGPRYANVAAGTFDALNPTSIAAVSRPQLWKYPTFSGPGDADESYDAADFQNMALALQTVTPRAQGRAVKGDATAQQTFPADVAATDPTIVGLPFLRLDLEDLPIPSFHRPDLVNYWYHKLLNAPFLVDAESNEDQRALAIMGNPTAVANLQNSSPAAAGQLAALKRKFLMRPLREDHPNFDGSNPASRNSDLPTGGLVRNGNLAVPFWEAVGPWDVDNDNDGVPDSVWVDLGDPVAQAEDGTLYKPLYAFLVVDLDSKLNVNAHGLVDDLTLPALDRNLALGGQGNLAHDLMGVGVKNTSNLLPHGLGYGPAEISLRPLLSPNLPGNASYGANVGNPGLGNLVNADDYARLLIGRPASDASPPVWGRYGIDLAPVLNAAFPYKSLPGITAASTALSQIGPPSIQTQFKFIGFPWLVSNYMGTHLPTQFSAAPDLMGRYALGLDAVGQPVNEMTGESADRPLLANSPYELDLSSDRRRGVRADELAMRVDQVTARTEYLNPATGAIVRTLAGVAKEDDDAPFATADLERILRAHDADTGALPDRLWNVVDAFDPLKLYDNQPAAVAAQALRQFTATGNTERFAAAQQLAEVNRRLVTTDSYDLPVQDASILARLTYGADGQPGTAGADDNSSGTPDEPAELGWMNSDDWYAVMNRGKTGYFNAAGAPTPPAGERLVPDHPTLVDLAKYRVQRERGKRNLPIFTDARLNQIVQELLPPEVFAGRKMDLNRPFGDGRDNGDGIDNDGANGIDDPAEANYPIGDSRRDPYMNGIVDDPLEAGEPFLDVNGNGKRDGSEPFIDLNANGQYNPPLDRLWNELTSEVITFDYTNGQAVPIHAQGYGSSVAAGGGVRNLNSQGRQLFARHLYCLMLVLTDENYLEMPDLPSLDGNNLNLELFLIDTAIKNGGAAFAATDPQKLEVRRKLTCQRIAQWAINCADFRDADAIMTAFEYDEHPWDGWGCLEGDGSAATPVNIPLDGDIATNENLGQIIQWSNVTPSGGAGSPPTRPIVAVMTLPVAVNQTRGVVWGVERPELLITETLAYHDRRATDEVDNGSIVTFNPNDPPEKRDYDLDQRLKPRGSMFIELYNPWSKDGAKPREFYGQVVTNPSEPANSQGVMLNRLSDLRDPVSNKFSPVWRMSVMRDPLNGRMPVFRNPTTGKLDSGVLNVATYGAPNATDTQSVSADFLTIDPDGYGIDMDQAAERQVYFTTGGDTNRSNDENPISQGATLGEWDLTSGTPMVNQLNVRVPPLPKPKVELIAGQNYVTSSAKRYFIARNERIENPSSHNDIDVTIAPILPGRYAVVGSSGLQLRGLGTSTARADEGQLTERFVSQVSRDAMLSEDNALFGTLPRMRRIELWPNAQGRPDINQVLVAQNGGQEFVRIDNVTVVNATDPDNDDNPTTPAPSAPQWLIDPAIAIPVEDLSASEPVDGCLSMMDVGTRNFHAGYPSATYRKLYEQNQPQNTSGAVPFPDQLTLRVSPQGELEFWNPMDPTNPASQFFDRPLDVDFELVRNGTTQNYRSVHLQRLANPTLPWNPLPYNADGTPNALHRAWLPVNPYRTIDSQSTDLTALNSATTLERTNLPVNMTFDKDLTNDLLQSNILAPITATQFLNGPTHEIWAMILLMKLKNPPISIGNSPDELRAVGATPGGLDTIEARLNDLEPVELDNAARADLTSRLQEQPPLGAPPTWKPKYPTGMVQGWSWHMYRRSLPDDPLAPPPANSFRQWLHFKSLERGYHASSYFKYPKPGAFYAANPQTLEGWAPDVSVMPRTLWKQERANARLFLRGVPDAAGNTGVVDASDLKNSTSWRILSSTASNSRLTTEEESTTIPDSEISRNRLVWSRLAASAAPGTEPGAVFDYVLEQTLGFANRSYTPDLERQTTQIASAMAEIPRLGIPEIAITSNRRPADPLRFELAANRRDKEIWNSQRKAARLQGPNAPKAQPSLLQAAVNTGNTALVNQLTQEFYDRRRMLTASTFPWLTWNDRPLVSAEEITQVPASSSSLMLRDYSIPNRFTVNPYDGSPFIGTPPAVTPKTVAQQVAARQAPFGHLLNFFASYSLPSAAVTDPTAATGAANFQRILNYVEVPSRYVGTDTLLSPEIFNDPVGGDIQTASDPRFNFQPPFNKVSRQRDPGKVNLNLVTGRRQVETNGFVRHWSEVYDGIMHRYGDGNLFNLATNTLMQLGQFGPAWRDVVLSRRGYAQYNADGSASPIEKLATTQVQPETFDLALNRDFPSMFSNPFRSADAGDLVPLPNMIRSGIEATYLRGQHWQRADDNFLLDNPFATQGSKYGPIAWGIAGYDDDGNGIVDDAREAGFGAIDPTVLSGDTLSRTDGDTLRIKPSLNNSLEGSGIPLFSEQVPEPAIDAERNPGMMYQPMTRLGNLVTTRSNVYAVWVTVGYFEVEKAPDFADQQVQRRFGGDGSWTPQTTNPNAASTRARALYDRVYPDGYQLGEELGTDTGNTRRPRAFYIIDRTEPVGFKPGEDLNIDKIIRVRRRIE